ncbi:hypothetical protein PSPO01_04855 [Paraphaeosphaeria sporulosa]
MFFSKVVAIAVLTFATSAVAAPTATEFDVAAPVAVREAGADGTSFDVEARQPHLEVDVDVDGGVDWAVADEGSIEAREAKTDLQARGFGCGVFSSRYECNDHCKSLGGGRTGGYCGGFLYHTCKCVFG